MASLKDLGFLIPGENVRQDFTRWVPWTNRLDEPETGHPLHEYSGVYLLAHIEGKAPDGSADPTDARVIYVGEGGHLGRRWYNFQRSVGARSGHSGGHSYRERFKRTTPRPTLHVATFPVWLRESEPEPDPSDPRTLTCRLRHHIEQGLLWHHYYSKCGSNLLNRK